MTLSQYSDASTSGISDELLSAYVDNQVSGPERQRIEQALETDVSLQQRLQVLENTVRLIGQMPQAAVPRAFVLSEELVMVSGGRVRGASKPGFFSRFMPSFLPVATAVVAVALVVVVGVDVWSAMPNAGMAPAPAEMAQEIAAAPMRSSEQRTQSVQATVVVEMEVVEAPAAEQAVEEALAVEQPAEAEMALAAEQPVEEALASELPAEAALAVEQPAEAEMALAAEQPAEEAEVVIAEDVEAEQVMEEEPAAKAAPLRVPAAETATTILPQATPAPPPDIAELDEGLVAGSAASDEATEVTEVAEVAEISVEGGGLQVEDKVYSAESEIEPMRAEPTELEPMAAAAPLPEPQTQAQGDAFSLRMIEYVLLAVFAVLLILTLWWRGRSPAI